MSDRLVVSGGGVVRFETAAIATAAESARHAAAEARSIADAIDRVDTECPIPAAGGLIEWAGMHESSAFSGATLAYTLQDASGALRREADSLGRLAEEVVRAREAYLDNERSLEAWLAALHSTVPSRGWWQLISVGISNLPRDADGWKKVLDSVFLGWHETIAHPERLGQYLLGLLATREGVLLMGLIVDAAAGLPVMNDPVSAALVSLLGGEDEFRELATVMIFGAAPVLLDGPVRVRRLEGAPVAAPPASTVRDHISRIPEEDAAGSKIRIDAVQRPDGSIGATVYIGGTEGTEGQSFDNLSNIVLSMGQGAGSQRAVEQAIRDFLEEAGLPMDTPLTLVGYSQGGLDAARVQEGGRWNVQGILTVGSPGTWITAPDEIAHLAIEHEDDMIVGLNGTRASDTDAVRVSRNLLDGQVGDGVFAAHHIDDYVETAGLADGSSDPAVRHEVDGLLQATAGTVIASSTFATERLSPFSNKPPAPSPAPSEKSR